MFAIIGAILFSVIVIMSVLLLFGAPLGEFTMGGKIQVFKGKQKIMIVCSMLIQIFAIIIILQTGKFIPLLFSIKVTRIICLVFAIYLFLNTIMNFLSPSKKEKYVMTPLSFLTAICFLMTYIR